MKSHKINIPAPIKLGVNIGFKIHAITFVIINALILIINLITTPTIPWFFFSLIGWGSGLAIHALVVFQLLDGQNI